MIENVTIALNKITPKLTRQQAINQAIRLPKNVSVIFCL